MAITYKQAGVDIAAGEALVERIKPLARSTRTPNVVDDVGGFAGLCALPTDVDDPLLVSGTDGVGTKLKVAFATGRHDTVGQDLVAMCVNDIVTCGARPLFFLDYFACGRLEVEVGEAVVSGIADGCRLAGCALLGGETAELPGMYPDGEYDLAGFAVGVVSRAKVLGRDRVGVDDAVIAVAASGIHSNGYSLARRVLQDEMQLPLDEVVPALGATLGAALLVPTRIYAKAVRGLQEALGDDLHALCHVTGGGVPGNLPRVLPDGVVARVRRDHERPAIFDVIQRGGPVDDEEMRRTFNMGVGLIAMVARDRADEAVAALRRTGERAWHWGQLGVTAESGPARVEYT
jgi:phosphoribosylformylglycinamidine cyclo-ligase